MADHTTLEVWKLADSLAKAVFRLIRLLPPCEQPILGDQLWRACLSVPLNIVEGYARSSPKQLAYHLNVAIGSLNEAAYLLELAVEVGALPSSDAAPTIALTGTLRRKLGAFMRAIQDGRSRHARFGAEGRVPIDTIKVSGDS